MKHEYDAFEELDLEPIIAHLEMRGYLHWDSAKLRDTAEWYRRLLYLRAIEKRAVLVPTNDIDEFWHAHILNTDKYRNDCEKLFHGFIDHRPLVNLNCDEEGQLKDNFSNTLRLFRKYFNEVPDISSGCAICDMDPGPGPDH